MTTTGEPRHCKTPGCGKPYRARGFCITCYGRFRAQGGETVLPRRTDNLCAKCRTRSRIYWNSYCRECGSEYERERRRSNAEKINARRREQHSADKSILKRHRLRKYGLTLEQFYAIREKQNGACAICGTVTEDLHVDHDHACCPERFQSCGKCIRGLLCSNCNNGLGRFKDDAPTIIRAGAYLLRHAGAPIVAVLEGERDCTCYLAHEVPGTGTTLVSHCPVHVRGGS